MNDNTNELSEARQGENSLLNLLKKQKSFICVVANTADDINTAIITAYTLGISAVNITRLSDYYTIHKEIHVYSGLSLISNGAFLKNFMVSGCMIRNHNMDATVYNGDSNIVIDGLVLEADGKEVVLIALAHIKNCTI